MSQTTSTDSRTIDIPNGSSSPDTMQLRSDLSVPPGCYLSGTTPPADPWAGVTVPPTPGTPSAASSSASASASAPATKPASSPSASGSGSSASSSPASGSSGASSGS